MGKFLDAIKRGVAAAEAPPTGDRYTLVGKPVVCVHCGHDLFLKGQALLNTAGMTFMRLDWADRSAHTLACTECGMVAWSLQAPEQVQ